ncbi:hypothetical protein D3C73_1667460 [compost metagenome]
MFALGHEFILHIHGHHIGHHQATGVDAQQLMQAALERDGRLHHARHADAFRRRQHQPRFL